MQSKPGSLLGAVHRAPDASPSRATDLQRPGITAYLLPVSFALLPGCFIDFGKLCTPTDEGLVAEWKFDEGKGQSTANTLGACHAFTLGRLGALEEVDDPRWVSGARVCSGTGLEFDGSHQLAMSGAHLSRAFMLDFCSFVDSSQTNEEPRILSTEDEHGDGFSIFVHRNRLTARHRVGESEARTEAAFDQFDRWSCWRITYDDDGDRSAHVLQAGAETYVKTNPDRLDRVAGVSHVATNPLVLGNRRSALATDERPLVGVIDEVRLFNRVFESSPPKCSP